jgi:hypothetical protein
MPIPDVFPEAMPDLPSAIHTLLYDGERYQEEIADGREERAR